MTRILSQHGNVIAADFRPRAAMELTISIKTETLYCDGLVVLLRTSAAFEGKAIGKPWHTLGDLTTGHVVQI